MSTNNLGYETCRIVFIKMTAKSKFLLARPNMAQMVKIAFINFDLARLIFTGQNSHLTRSVVLENNATLSTDKYCTCIVFNPYLPSTRGKISAESHDT